MNIKIIGSGLTGCTLAYLLNKKKYSDIEIYEEKNNIAGNCYTYFDKGIEVHKYGPHIFNTKNKKIWDFVNSLTEFNKYKLNIISQSKYGEYFLPFNLSVINNIYKVHCTPQNIDYFLNKISIKYKNEPKNLEQKAKSFVGSKIFNYLIKNYVEKQWNRKCSDIPASYYNKCPLRKNYNIDYFDTEYQGFPIYGYMKLFDILTKGIKIYRNKKWSIKEYNKNDLYFYTGQVDKLLNYKFGKLDWRCVKFEHLQLNIKTYLGNSCIVYPDKEIPYLRQTEFKYFHPENEIIFNNDYTVICREYTDTQNKNNRCYPLTNDRNLSLYEQYRKYINKKYPNIILCGRLGSYKYYNMDKCIEECFNLLCTY